MKRKTLNFCPSWSSWCLGGNFLESATKAPSTPRKTKAWGKSKNLIQRHFAAMNIYDNLRVKPLLPGSLVVIAFIRL